MFTLLYYIKYCERTYNYKCWKQLFITCTRRFWIMFISKPLLLLYINLVDFQKEQLTDAHFGGVVPGNGKTNSCFYTYGGRNDRTSSPVFSGVRVTRSLVLCVCFVDRCLSFCPFSFGHYVVCSSTYGFWLPLWYLQTLLNNNADGPYIHHTRNVPSKQQNVSICFQDKTNSVFSDL